jgi:predicted nucleic acid-binding protein
MRLVLDTNTVVSGLLWSGAPRRVLDAARAGQATLFTTLVQ